MKTKPEKFSADVVSTAGVELVQIPLGKKTVIQFRVRSRLQALRHDHAPPAQQNNPVAFPGI